MLFYLICSHFLCDYPLQSDFIAIGKSPLKGSHNGVPWYWIMLSHAFTHGAGVGIVTGDVLLGILETIAHFFIDVAKCMGITTINQDQFLHIGCKLVWWIIILVK